MSLGTIITDARIAAAHDGSAELKVTLRYENGGTAEITLDEPGSRSLMEACGARDLSDLHGQSWEKVKDALSVSWNRLRRQSCST